MVKGEPFSMQYNNDLQDMESEGYAGRYDKLISQSIIEYNGCRVPFASFSESREMDGTPIRKWQERRHRRKLVKAAEKSIAEKAVSILNESKRAVYGQSGAGMQKRTWKDLIGGEYEAAAIENMFTLIEGCFKDYRDDVRHTFCDFMKELTVDFLSLSYLELWDPNSGPEEEKKPDNGVADANLGRKTPDFDGLISINGAVAL